MLLGVSLEGSTVATPRIVGNQSLPSRVRHGPGCDPTAFAIGQSITLTKAAEHERVGVAVSEVVQFLLLSTDKTCGSPEPQEIVSILNNITNPVVHEAFVFSVAGPFPPFS